MTDSYEVQKAKLYCETIARNITRSLEDDDWEMVGVYAWMLTQEITIIKEAKK